MTDAPGIIEQESPHAAGTPPTWYARKPADIVAALDSDLERGLSRAEAAARLSRYGPNRIAKEKPPSVWAIALGLLREPMNIMLVAVVVVSILIGEFSTALIVGLLIALNVVLGTRQELTARASVDALSKSRRSTWCLATSCT
jgi:Ca2+-transporting ATPase